MSLVTIFDQTGGPSVTVNLGEGAPKPSYPDLGWKEIGRPKRSGFSDWTGTSLLRMSLPILLDGLRENRSVQAEFNRLEQLSRPRGGRRHPAHIRIYGPIPHRKIKWVIEQLEWGDDALRNETGTLIRVSATLRLMQYKLADIAPKRRKRSRRHRVKAGETLQGIAQRELGSAKRWREILRRNRKKIKDPRHLKTGTILSIP